MEINRIIKANIFVFLTYLALYSLNEFIDLGFLSLLIIFFGTLIFFISGFDAAAAIKSKLNLELDIWETLLIGAIVSLFFIPLIIFLLYKISGYIDSHLNVLVYCIISLLSLLFLKYNKKDAERKI